MIKYNSSKQVSIDEFLIPLGGRLHAENRWIKLARLIPWDELCAVYSKKMSAKMGRRGIHPRIIIGAVIIKHMKSLSDEETIEEIRENAYMQYFLGFSEYSYEQVFTPSLFVTIRRRLGEKEFGVLMERIINTTEDVIAKQQQSQKPKKSDKDKDNDGGNQGHLIVDATVAPADIKFPTDLDLLNQSRQKSESLIDQLWEGGFGKTKPRTYRQKAKADYLSLAKTRKKNKKKLRKAIGKQLRYLGRNLSTIEKMLDKKETVAFPLANVYQRSYWIIQEVYRQQKEMFDKHVHTTAYRIVSISQPHLRPIVRGKAGKNVEFGAKLSVSLVNGLSRLHKISWEACNESKDLIGQIEAFSSQNGYYPKYVSADQIYGTHENRQYMKSKGIIFTGVELGRPKQLNDETRAQMKQKRKKRRERVMVEGKFGEGKRKYQLGLVKAKRSDTSESWIGSVFFVMNIAHLLRVIFLSFFEKGHFSAKILKATVHNQIFRLDKQFIPLKLAAF
jgi:hypothetical protein